MRRVTRALGLVFGVLSAMSALRATGTSSTHMSSAVARFEQLEIDRGKVLAGDKAAYSFIVHNDGDVALVLDVHATCGCTTPRWDATIAPGAQGKIETELSTAGLFGPTTKVIEVLSNDPAQPRRTLKMVLDVRRSVEVTPSEIPVIALPDTGPATFELTVRFVGHTAEIKQAVSGSSHVTASAQRSETEGEWRVKLDIAATVPQGRTVAMIALTTSSWRQPTVNITAVLERGLCATPPNLYFGAVGPDTLMPLTREATITRGRGGLAGCRVTTADRRLTARLVPNADGKSGRLQVTYNGGWTAKDIRSQVLLDTGPGSKPLTIPVIAYCVPAQPKR